MRLAIPVGPLSFSGERHIRSGGAQPYRGIVKYRATHRRSWIITGQRVDADAAFECGIRPYTLRHQDAGLQTVEQVRMKHDFAARVAEPYAIAVRDTEPR